MARLIKVSLIGAGKRGTKLLSYLLATEGVEITAICDELLDYGEHNE